MSLSRTTEERRVESSKALNGDRRATLGQFFTPEPVARIMAAMLGEISGRDRIRLLDPGAGVGSLSAAAVAELCSRSDDKRPISLVAYELDDTLHGALTETLRACESLAKAAGRTLVWDVRGDDYVTSVASSEAWYLGAREPERYDAVIMNPPYRKVNVRSPERVALEAVGVPISNLYVAFLALAALQLESDGVLVAITPRSFASGRYFEPFRHFFFDRVGIERLHTFESRGALFADSDVLQENIIFSARRGAKPSEVHLTISHNAVDPPTHVAVPASEVIHPQDGHRFLRIPSEDDSSEVARTMMAMPATLADLGIKVSTGRVVDFRAREHLRAAPGPDTAPLIYPGHLRDGAVRWPGPVGFRKPNALAITAATETLLLPNETYVLVKRFTSKEERKRVAAALSQRALLPGDVVAFENHLNVYHRSGRGLEPDLAYGLAAYLNSSLVDRYVRQFNGHTQINATDLRHLRYPTPEQLVDLGCAALTHRPNDQDALDVLVSRVLPQADTGAAPAEAA